MNDDEASEAASEALDENGKPFWMKFFKADYLEEESEAQEIPQKGKKGQPGKQDPLVAQIKEK